MMVAGAVNIGPAERYLASVFHMEEGNKKVQLAQVVTAEFVPEVTVASGSGFYNKNENLGDLNIDIVNDPSEAYVKAGREGKEMMKFRVKAGEEDVMLKFMKLKVEGVDAEMVTRAIMVVDDEKVSEGRMMEDYFLFDMRHEVEAGSVSEISLVVNLSENLTSGSRVRMDVEAPEDLEIISGGERFFINEFYPIEGKALSIIQNRPWMDAVWVAPPMPEV